MHIFLIMQVKWFEKKTKDAQDKNYVSHHITDVEREIDSNAAIKKEIQLCFIVLTSILLYNNRENKIHTIEIRLL